MALPSHIAFKPYRSLEPKLPVQAEAAVLSSVFTINLSAHSPRHSPPLIEGIAGDAGLVRIAGAVGFCGTDALEPDLLAGLAMDRSINIMDRDGEADKSDAHCWRLIGILADRAN